MNAPTLKRDWKAYYNAVADRPPRKTILTALEAFKQPGLAMDLGCGDGRDTVEILKRNWQVLAIDREPDALKCLLSRPNINPQQLITQTVSFEQLQFPHQVNLINASFCLPFCSPDAFPSLWNKIFNSLVVGGRFCGHLFGDRDSWSDSNFISTFTRSQVEILLKPYTVELLEEEKHPGKTPLGEDRDWHLFHIVAQKK